MSDSRLVRGQETGKSYELLESLGDPPWSAKGSQRVKTPCCYFLVGMGRAKPETEGESLTFGAPSRGMCRGATGHITVVTCGAQPIHS